MTLKNYLLVMGVLTVFCWGIFLFVANLVDPTSTNWLGFVLFYLSLFFQEWKRKFKIGKVKVNVKIEIR